MIDHIEEGEIGYVTRQKFNKTIEQTDEFAAHKSSIGEHDDVDISNIQEGDIIQKEGGS